MTREKAQQLRRLMVRASAGLTDSDALQGLELFDAWAPDTAYEADLRIRYGGKLYRVVQAHTSQPDWCPDQTPALYTEVAEPGEIPVWRQPTGTQDAYGLGDKVHYPDAAGPVWTSTVEANTWKPGIYGWEAAK